MEFEQLYRNNGHVQILGQLYEETDAENGSVVFHDDNGDGGDDNHWSPCQG